jgi:hypothetical protein
MKIEFGIPSLHRPMALARCIASISEQKPECDCRILFNNKTQNVVKVFNDFYNSSDADVVVCVTDDCKIKDGFIDAVEDAFRTHFSDFDGMLGLNQCNLPSAPEFGMWALGKTFLDRFPYRAAMCPDYDHFYPDQEMYEYAKSIGRFHFCEGARVHHYHPDAAGGDAKDETHNISRKNKHIDHETFIQRKKDGLLWGDSFGRVSR